MQLVLRPSVPLLPRFLISAGAILLSITLTSPGYAAPVKPGNPVFQTDVLADDADATDGPRCREPTAAGALNCKDNKTTANTRPKGSETLAVLTTAWPGNKVAPGEQAQGVANSKASSPFNVAVKQAKYSFTVTTSIDVSSMGGAGKVTVMAYVATPAVPPNKPEATVKDSVVQVSYEFVRDPANPAKIDVIISGPKGKTTQKIDNPDILVDKQESPNPFAVDAGNYLLKFELNAQSTAKAETSQMTNASSVVELQ